MSDQASREDLEKAREAIISRIDELDDKAQRAAEGFRQQQSAEHGAIQGSLISLRDAVWWIRDWCRRMFTHDKH